ncbi:ABC transporter permease [Bartonella sp. HY329]|uniref:ABC transporter permease n=1 Tax=unclassified Bartonella TaxID=2645622 RepID=UPI0021C7C4C1|nr:MULTISPECIES: ABC transporter permease [unclassified Bartonella]UXM94035.1 ABC transporter permease [Bartonella sp. HY329]UXN08357.1 ABC transporter permease [Bartonella sp. HY328]
MRKIINNYPSESALIIVLTIIGVILSFTTDTFFTLANFSSLLNNNAVSMIWAFGLLVVLIAGGIDVSFAVAASVVQYLCVKLFGIIPSNWFIGIACASAIGAALGLINAFLIQRFHITSIVITIATFNAFFGLLMFFSGGKFLYDLPDWLINRINFAEYQSSTGSWAELTLPTVTMFIIMLFTWLLLRYTNIGRQLYAFGNNPEGARRLGISPWRCQAIAFGWLGVMAGIGGLMQAHLVQEVVPNALIGRELDVLAAVVLGGARLGGGRGTVLGCFLGVLLVAVTQNSLNLLGVSPYAFKMVIGAVILLAISLPGLRLLKTSRRPETA